MANETPGPPPEDKKYTREDILSSENIGDVLHAYRKVSAEFRSYEELVDLQTSVADKMHELGDEEKSSDFTLLASQTRNTERNVRATNMLGEVVEGFGRKVNQFSESTDDLRKFTADLGGVMEEFRLTGGRISGAAEQMDQAARTIASASR